MPKADETKLVDPTPDESKVTETAVKEPDDKLRGIKRANKTLQTERDQLAEKLAKFEAEAAKAKMTAEERAASELAALNKKIAELQAESEKAKSEAERERKISKLIAQHDLADPEFGDLILKKFNPDEHDDFDTFVKDIKKQPKYGALFRGEKTARITNEDGSDIVPAVPHGSNANGQKSGKGYTDQDEELARSQFPGNPDKQKKFLDQLATSKRGSR